MKCIKCGNELAEGAKFCNLCGETVVEQTVTEPPQEKTSEVTTTQVATPEVTSSVETVATPQVETSTPVVDDIKKKAVKRIEYSKNVALITLIITTLLFAFLYVNSMKEKNNCKCETLSNDTTTKETEKTKGNNYAEDLDISGVTVKAEEDNERTNNIKYINMGLIKPTGSYSKTRLSMLFENNNDSLTSGTVYLNYYKDGTRIDSDLGSFSLILPNSKFVVTIDPNIDEEYDSIDITYKASLKTSGTTQVAVDTSKLKAEKVSSGYSSEVDVTYTNDTDGKATYYPAIIYKKDGKEVGYHYSIMADVEKGQTGKSRFYDSNAPEYDSYEVFIQSAYTRNN